MKCLFCNNEEFNNRLIVEDYFNLIVKDKHPIINDHYLFVPKSHSLSFLSLTKKQIYDGLHIIETFIKSKKTDNWFIFEKGNITENISQEISVDHTHIHISRFISNINEKLNNSLSFNNIEDVKEYFERKRFSYYLYSEFPFTSFVIGNSKEIKSQFIREQIAIQYNTANWNWKNEK